MLFKLVFILLVWIFEGHRTYSSNILGFISESGRSHCIIHEALFKALALRGHNVTVVTACASKTPSKLPSNYYELHLTKTREDPEALEEIKDIFENTNKFSRNPGMEIVRRARGKMTQTSYNIYSDPVTKNLLKSTQKFDLFILGWAFNDHLLGFAAHFKCPSIVMSTVGSLKRLRDFVASSSGYQHNYFYGNIRKEQITFLKRIEFFVEHVLEFILLILSNYFVHQPYYDKNFPASGNYPSISEVKRNVSLVFLGHHFSQGSIRPSVPNLIEIGGVQIKNKPDPLPQHIKAFLENANEHGAILFSMGTSISSSEFAPDKLLCIITVFGKLKQKILWKWDGIEIQNKPDNVLMSKWLPQDDILAHPNVRLFISHCGLGGITEALFHAVPILAIPVFNEQRNNAKEIIEDGWATQLAYESISIETFSTAINNMFSNRSYTNRVKALSLLYRDRPQTALETAIYWTEYVLRHNGAPHLQSPLVHMNFVQQYSLDVIAFLISCTYLVFKFIKWAFVRMFQATKRMLRRAKLKSN